MENKISKGELLEELLRNYFLNLGYFVSRGIKYRYENNDITDVDLFLYDRSSTLSRERINVDIKNKKTPQAFERILWVNGLKKLLGFDKCIVATTDNKPIVQKFGLLHETIVLDGNFISKLKNNGLIDRLTEEEFSIRLAKNKSYKKFPNKDWRFLYENSKSKLLNELDYSGFNSNLFMLQYLFETIITDVQKKEDATRFAYIIISHLLIMMDFILKDITFLETNKKNEHLRDGLNYGNLGKDGVDEIINIAVALSGKSRNYYNDSLNSSQYAILSEFFSKNEILKGVFNWAKSFEQIAFKIDFIAPNNLDSIMKAIISVFLDYFSIDRTQFFSPSYQVQGKLPLQDKD
ncbi:MAG: hypothetical protein K0R77_2140 [Chryseobacterium sp.]|jgi:hypothetical protein|uniref:hypothetical protein n=1 Tax=Chryseobacterium sp. TaxID=1871047 RepID=UPI00262F8D3C|nr:hypothetical protein [Chryseobacterium sp.]MDF2552865.1 hypothetical protein [Chryseobacterium sp.]